MGCATLCCVITGTLKATRDYSQRVSQRRIGQWYLEHGLLLTNLTLFIVFLVGMALTGWQVSSEDQVAHGGEPLALGAYLLSPDFFEATFENWESEFLQMGAYVVLTVFLFQRGSSESKPIGKSAPQDEDPALHRDDPDAPWPVRRGGWILSLYQNSLLIFFAVLFLASWSLHLVSGAGAYSEEQQLHGLAGVTPLEYLGTSQFWFESFQNWQSEFLAVAAIVGGSIFLRQRGSAESKPVAASHDSTGD